MAENIVNLLWHTGACMFQQVSFFVIFAFFLAFIVCFFLKRKRILRRPNRYWNFLTKLHYVFIFVVFLSTGCGIGVMRGIEKEVDYSMEKYLHPVLHEQLLALREFAIVQLTSQAPGTTLSTEVLAENFLKLFRYKAKNESFSEQLKLRFSDWVCSDLGKWMVMSAIKSMVKHATHFGSESLGVDESSLELTVAAFQEVDLSQTDSKWTESIFRALQSKVHSIFLGFYLKILLIFSGLMLIPLTEILIFHLWWKKRNIKLSKI